MSLFITRATQDSMPLVFEIALEIDRARDSGAEAAVKLSEARAELRENYPDRSFDFIPHGYVMMKAEMHPRNNFDICCCRYLAVER